MAEEQPRPPRRPFGRSWSDFEPPPTAAEKKLAEAARSAEQCVLGSEVPEEAKPENTIRAGFLRFLALGGDETAPVHEKGVWLQGAFIDGELDLYGATLPFDLFLLDCRFDASIVLLGARGRTINLNGSHFVGLQGDGLELDGSLFLHEVHAAGEIGLLGARIPGNVECDGGRFENAGDDALSCRANENNPACRRGRSWFQNERDCALSCDRAEIGGALFFRKGIVVQGATSFADAVIGTLVDHPSLWQENSLILDGFRYQHISAESPLDAKTRIAWLYKQQKRCLEGENFALQPWTHLAKVLREQGHFREAAEVDIAREDLLRRAGRVSYRPLHYLYGLFAGYGYRPGRVILIAIAIWIACGAFYYYTASQAAFGPSNALVFQNPAYEHCRPDAPATPVNGSPKVGNWTKCDDLPGEYTSFSPYIYSLDLILPVVSLAQPNDWTPITSGDDWSLGYVVRFATWFEELFGWVTALTLAAIASGLVKRRDGE